MSTSERLSGYYSDFTPETIDSVSSLAEWQASFASYGDFFSHMGIEKPHPITIDGYRPVEILDIRRDEEEPDKAIVYHLPMANPLDPNMIYQAATIAKANPGWRLIAMGNPNGQNGFGSLNSLHRDQVANGNLWPVVAPLSHYLEDQDISTVRQVGYSYGTDTVNELAAANYQETEKAVYIDPASVVPRNRPNLGLTFASTNKHLNEYVQATGLSTFEDARKASIKPLPYLKGLLKPTNLAVAKNIAIGEFEDNIYETLEAQPDMKASVIWASESELAINSVMALLSGRLKLAYGKRVGSMRLNGQYHAFANDVHLQAALVLESFKD